MLNRGAEANVPGPKNNAADKAFVEPSTHPLRDKSLGAPLRISLLYLLFGISWIVVSDFALIWSSLFNPGGSLVSMTKGVVFVCISSILIYLLLRQHVKSVSRANALTQAVVHGTIDAVFVKDRQGRYLLCNEGVAKVVEKPIDQIIGKDDRHLFDSDSALRLFAIDQKIMQSGRAETSEEQLATTGEPRTYLASKAPFRDSSGEVVGLIGVSRDITERKQVEIELREERDRFERIVETVPLVICSFQRRLDGTFCIPYASPKIYDLFGLTPEQLADDATRCFDTLNADEAERILSNIDKSAREMQTWSERFRINSPILGEVWVEVSATPTSQTDGTTIWHGYLANITDRYHAEVTLHEIQKRLKDAQVIANMGSWTWIPSKNQVWWSEAIYDLFGAKPDTHAPSFEAFLALLDDHDREIAQARVQRVLNGADGFADELRIRRADGRVLWIYSVGRALRDEHGNLLRVDGFDQDISDRRRLEEQLRQAQKMEAVGRLAGGVAHDFNNLLTVIQGYCEVLLFNFSDSPKNRLSIEAIQQAAERAAQLTRQLLAFSRKAIVEKRTLDLNEVVLQLEIMLRRLILTNIQIEIELDPQPCFIEADPTQIDQVILNLALNARDAMPNGGKLSISTRRVNHSMQEPITGAELANLNYVQLCVSDTGQGMSEEVKSRMFEPFFTTKEKGKGTGLGLAVVHGIITQSRGQITVESAVNQGTTFTILFNEVQAAAYETQAIASKSSSGTETILLVEDEDSVRELFRETLAACGYNVIAAASGQAALDIAAIYKEPIHLLVTDLMMPSMSGHELSSRLRQLGADIPVLYISGYYEDAVLKNEIRIGIDDFLHKPFLPQTLASKARAILDGGLD